jgi:hypothetical protein
MNEIIDFPKIKSPFVRKTINGKYLATPEIEEGFEWVFEDPTVLATDKLHGTNICCIFEKGILQCIDNRKNRLIGKPVIWAGWRTDEMRVIQGIMVAIEKKWIEKDFTGRIYGELVGPTINRNLHQLDKHYFVPFDYLKKHCKWNTWSANKYPKTFDSIKEWFKDLISLFTKRITKENKLGEGIVFHGPNGKMAKLKRVMFEYEEDI